MDMTYKDDSSRNLFKNLTCLLLFYFKFFKVLFLSKKWFVLNIEVSIDLTVNSGLILYSVD